MLSAVNPTSDLNAKLARGVHCLEYWNGQFFSWVSEDFKLSNNV